MGGGVNSNTFLLSFSAILFVDWLFTHLAFGAGKCFNLLTYFGKNSLPIYLTHYFFLPSLTFVQPLLNVPIQYGLAWEFALAVLGLCLVLPPTILVIRVIQANAYLRLLIYGERSRGN